MKRVICSTTVPPVFSSIHYERSRMWKNGGAGSAALRRTLVTPDYLAVVVDGDFYYRLTEQTFDLDAAASWDTQVPVDYAVAANRAGIQFYVYACVPVSDVTPTILCSVSSTFPSGYNATTSRKIASFHCLCLSAGTIAGHSLTGYLTGDILPRSVQDILHRPKSGFMPGMVWGGYADYDSLNYAPLWKAIYLASGTGASVASVFGATISDSRDWNAFVSDFGLIGCRMMNDHEFQVLATGCNEETNISSSADPVTTGGHVDTASRRMISNIGSEDDAGVLWQWLSDQSYRHDADGIQAAATQLYTVNHTAALEGKALYLKRAGLEYVIVADIADDLWLTFGSYKFMVMADADPSTDGVMIYYDHDGTLPLRLFAVVGSGKNAMIRTTHKDFNLIVAYHATPATIGVELRYDDVTHSRLEAILPSGSTATIDLSISSVAWAYYNLAGIVGSIYRQGAYGDAKLLGGGYWGDAADAGSRARHVGDYRWITGSRIGGRFVAMPI